MALHGDQRVEMVHRDGGRCAVRIRIRVFNIGGGPTWQMRGRDYVRDFYDVMGAPVELATYRETPGWVDWYDTEESQHILRYQNHSYQGDARTHPGHDGGVGSA